jgi:hypothetical protein
MLHFLNKKLNKRIREFFIFEEMSSILLAQKYVATLPYYLEKTLGGSIKIVVNKMLNLL